MLFSRFTAYFNLRSLFSPQQTFNKSFFHTLSEGEFESIYSVTAVITEWKILHSPLNTNQMPLDVKIAKLKATAAARKKGSSASQLLNLLFQSSYCNLAYQIALFQRTSVKKGLGI